MPRASRLLLPTRHPNEVMSSVASCLKTQGVCEVFEFDSGVLVKAMVFCLRYSVAKLGKGGVRVFPHFPSLPLKLLDTLIQVLLTSPNSI